MQAAGKHMREARWGLNQGVGALFHRYWETREDSGLKNNVTDMGWLIKK